jgi:hypothetical protein
VPDDRTRDASRGVYIAEDQIGALRGAFSLGIVGQADKAMGALIAIREEPYVDTSIRLSTVWKIKICIVLYNYHHATNNDEKFGG